MLGIDPDSWARRFGEADVENPAFVDWCMTTSHLNADQIGKGIELVQRGSIEFRYLNQNNFYRLCGGAVLGSDNHPRLGEKFVRVSDLRTPEERCATAKPWIAKIRKDLAKIEAKGLE